MDNGEKNGPQLTLRVKCKLSQHITLRDISSLKKVEDFLKDLSKLTTIPHDKMALLRGFPPERISYHPSMTIQDIGITNQDTIIVELDTTGLPGCLNLLDSNTAVSDPASNTTSDLGSNLVKPSCSKDFPSSTTTTMSVVDPSWELIDPNPDIHALFAQFNENYFWNRLGFVTVEWSSSMTNCAGICECMGTTSGFIAAECRIELSVPLLKLRPRKDLVETLLHEMIHAYLFLNPVNGDQHDRASHGPDFLEHMHRINRLSGAKITIYHSFNDEVKNLNSTATATGHPALLPAKETNATSVVDPSWELIDPNPDIFALFAQFNKTYFWNRLGIVTVEWSSRMTKCAGICEYKGTRSGSLIADCRIKLSLPLLKLRPRKDLIETLLHEMIHAYLFLNPVPGDQHDRDGHGPNFQEHMHRINRLTGAKITIYHTFHDEVEHYQLHWWQCNGPCRLRPPFYGLVKRSMNRAPGPNDRWWNQHASTCNGVFIKVREPPPKENKKRKGSEIVDLTD